MAWASYEPGQGNVIATRMDGHAVDDREAVWASVVEVVDAVEAELDVFVASVEDRVMARMQATNGEPSAALHEALHRGVSAAVRHAS